MELESVEKLATDLESIVGKEYVLTDIFDRITYAVDPMPYDLAENEIPYTVVRPASAEEIAEILKYANKVGIPIFIHGSGTALHGAARPKCKCILLDTSRLDFIRMDEDNCVVECGPGVTVATLSAVLEEQGYFLPMVPGSKLIATIGGLIAVNTSGHVVDSCLGKPGDYVLGLKVVSPKGDLIETGTKCLRRPAGIDLTKVFVGSEGLLGVITEIRLRLLPKPEKAHAVVCYDTSEQVALAVQRMYRAKDPYPLFLELLDKESAAVGFSAQGLGPPKGCYALIDVIGWAPGEAAYKASKILETFKKENPIDAELIEDEAVWHKYWTAREVVAANLQTKGPIIALEIAPALDSLCEALHACAKLPDTIESLKDLEGVEFVVFGHIGALTIHPAFVLPKGLPDNLKRKINREIRLAGEDLNIRYQGCGGEWGLSSYRTYFIRKKYGEPTYSLLLGLKKAFDPNNILNRGNLEEW